MTGRATTQTMFATTGPSVGSRAAGRALLRRLRVIAGKNIPERPSFVASLAILQADAYSG